MAQKDTPQSSQALEAVNIDGARFEEGPGGLPVLRVATEQCTAEVFVLGAQVMRWAPTGQRPVLHVSPRCVFKEGKGMRGGVPVCFPWFADRTDDPRPDGVPSPKHGFLRTRPWQVVDLSLEDNGRVRVTLQARDDDHTRALFDHAFEATAIVSMGATLSVTLEVRNTGGTELPFEEALHTYFEVGDARRTRVLGLDAGPFVDKVDGRARKTWSGDPLTFAGEVDAVFVGHKGAVTIDDPVFERHLRVEKTGSRTTVVWNPGPVLAQTIPDIGPDAWRSFVCVESANALPHAVALPPGATHTLTQRVLVIPQNPNPGDFHV